MYESLHSHWATNANLGYFVVCKYPNLKAYIPIAKLQILTIYGRYQYLWYRYVFKTGFLNLSSVLLGDSLTSFGKTRK